MLFWQNNPKILQHRTIEERRAAAKLLQPYCPDEVSIVVDTMCDAANAAYGAIPERLYVIKDDVISYQGGVGPFSYDLAEVETCLTQIFQEQNWHGMNNNKR